MEFHFTQVDIIYFPNFDKSVKNMILDCKSQFLEASRKKMKAADKYLSAKSKIKIGRLNVKLTMKLRILTSYQMW